MLGLGCLKSCLGKIVLLVLLVAAAYGGWLWGPSVFPQLTAFFSSGEDVPVVTASPELAEATMDRFEALRRGEVGGQLALGASEVESVIRYSVPGIIPAGIGAPRIEMEDGVVTLSAHVALASLSGNAGSERHFGFLAGHA